MCILTSAKGLYHNLKNWNFDYCGNFKLMEQDYETALKAMKYCNNLDLSYKLKNWDFSQGAFNIEKNNYEEILKCIQMLIEESDN